MSFQHSLKGYIPTVSFVMGKKGSAQKRAPEVSSARQNLPPHEVIVPAQAPTATTHSQHSQALSQSYLFIEAQKLLSGPTTELLNKMIDAMGVKRDLVQITNLSDRNDSTSNYGAKVVIAFGEDAAKFILKSEQGLAQMRGRVHFLKTGERVIATFHPAFLIENPASKKDAWEDLKLAMREMNAP